MILFHSDLDNTLIYSHRHEIGDRKICVEHYQGREVSFMTLDSCKMLNEASRKLMFVPTTTRTLEQYQRIRLGIKEPEYALVCNGGVLLRKGIRDREWYEESLEMIKDCRQQLKLAQELMYADKDRCFEVRDIDGLFLFTKSETPLSLEESLRQSLDGERMEVFHNGTKVYALPKQLNKGKALKRLKKRLSPQFVIAAGDSVFDIPMLKLADFAMMPEELASCLKGKKGLHVFSQAEVFSDGLLKEILDLIENC